ADQEFRQCVQLEPRNPAPYAALATLLLRQDKRPDAEQVLLQAKQTMPDVPEGYRMLGDFYFSLNDQPKALQEYAALYQQHPQDERVLKNYVQLLIIGSQLDEASRLNAQLLKQHPNDVDAMVLQGQIQSAQGHPNDAVQSLQAALKSDPQNPVAHYSLGI